jgi:hypothetical protein
VTTPEWYFDSDCEPDAWDGGPTLTVAHLTRLFNSPLFLMERFTAEQVNQGLWYLVSNACSDHMVSALDGSVPWVDRRRCLEAIGTLYESLFARLCTDHLSHLDRGGTAPEDVSPLNLVCYMWWDLFPSWGSPDDPSRAESDATILEVLHKTLFIASTACREGALHGLGHWHLNYPGQVEAIIDEFLAGTPGIGPELLAYAQAARVGGVL